MAEIQKIRYTHEAIADFLIANPMASQGECAQFFGYSEPWLSQIIHSDAFQVYYRKLAEERGQLAIHSIPDKIIGLAALAMDKASERLTTGASETFIGDTMEKTLKALGYMGNGSGGNGVPMPQQHMHVHVDAETLANARERAAKHFSPSAIEVPVEAVEASK